MTVPAQTPVANHIGNGVTTAFAYGYKLLAETDVVVTIDNIVKTLNVDYAVSGVGVESGGTVTFTVAPAALTDVALVREVPLNRLTDYQYSGDFEAVDVNRDFDRLVMMMQDGGLALANTIRLPPGDPSSGVLPNAADRALKGFAFDSNGNIVLTAASGNADVLAAALASNTTPALGGGLVGYDDAQAYAAGTVGDGIKGAVAAAASATANVNTYKTDVADLANVAKGSALVGYKANATGAVGRPLSDKLFEFVSVKDFGAVGNGVTVDSAAFTSAMNAAGTVIVPPGTYRFASNFTIPNGKRLVMRDGAQLAVDNTFTLTIRGIVEAGVGQIFSGAGSVLGVKRVRPEWFGAMRTGAAHDDAPAFNKAELCMEAGITSDGDDMVMLLSNGVYGLAAQVVCTPNIASRIQWIGQGANNGTHLLALASWAGSHGVISLPTVNGVNTTGSSCHFSGFRVVAQTPGTGSLYGIVIGNSASLILQGGAHEGCLFEDVNVLNFSECWRIQHARLFQFRRCSGWVDGLTNGVCLRVLATTAGLFTGDLDFFNFQAVGESTGSKVFELVSTASGSSISGVRFHGCIFYYAPGVISSSGAGAIYDVWFTDGWQHDAVRGEAFTLFSTGAGSFVNDIHFSDGYVVRAQLASGKIFNISSASSGMMRNIRITGNYFGQSWGDAITITSTEGVTVTDNQFVDANGGSLLNMLDAKNTVFCNNTLGRLGGGSATYLVTNSGSSNYYSVRGNLSNGYVTSGTVNDAAPGAQRIVDGNF